MPTKTNPNSLLTALDFIAPVMEKKGTLSETHCSLNQNYATVYNGLIAMGAPIQEDIIAYPAHAPLRAALGQCKAGCSITIKDNGALFISAPPFSVLIKGVRVNQIQTTLPDALLAPLDDSFRAKLSLLEKVIKEEDVNPAKCALMISSGSMTATDGVIFLEYWHGQSLPSMMLPKEAAAILSAIKAPLTGFGFAENRSVTFWFGRAWFKTQLLDAKYPDLSMIANLPTNYAAVPVGLADAVSAVRAHSEDNDAAVYFGQNQLQSHSNAEEGAVYEVPGLTQGPIYNSKLLALALSEATAIDFDVKLRDERICGFVGNGIRGVLMSRQK